MFTKAQLAATGTLDLVSSKLCTVLEFGNLMMSL